VPAVGQHIAALDGIRGAAILLVIVHHLARSVEFEFNIIHPLLRGAAFGWVGVELFFVLSGFLITGILYDGKASGHFFRNFYMRRALRIFPLYYGTLLFVLLLRAVWPEAGVYGSENPAWVWAYLTNIVIAQKGPGAFGFVDHFWYLAIEQHFYLVWPLAVYLLNRRRLLGLAAVTFFVSLIWRTALVLGGTDPEATYVLTPARLDALCFGSILALVLRRPEGVPNLVKPAWLAGGASMMGILAIVVVRHTAYHADPVMQTLGYSLLAVFFGAMIILSLATPLQRVFDVGILRWLGKYSYGIYIWHPIIFILILHTDLARAIRGGSGMVEMVVSVALALGVMLGIALLSWHLWESQFLKLKWHFK
jgi:peptidoglycan/LPS O-acetylase OafA/YrhL